MTSSPRPTSHARSARYRASVPEPTPIACAAPLVTADTPGARELLVDEESALLVPPGNAKALAQAMRRLAADSELSRRIATGGRAAYEREASEPVLGARWRAIIERLL